MFKVKALKQVIIYTDGSCSGNPGPGGWAALLIYNQKNKTISGGEANTTNNRMELKAVIEALKALKEPCEAVVYTDSKYVQLGVTDWMPSWKKNNWQKSKGEVKNLDLWQELDFEIQKHKAEFKWVKAHNGEPNNELVDELARSESLKFSTIGF